MHTFQLYHNNIQLLFSCKIKHIPLYKFNKYQIIEHTTKNLVFTEDKKLKIIDFTCVLAPKVVQLPRQFNNEPYF